MHGLPLEHLLPCLFVIAVVNINDVFHIFRSQVPVLPLPALHSHVCTWSSYKANISVAYLFDHGIEEHLLGWVDPVVARVCFGDAGGLPLLGERKWLVWQWLLAAWRHLIRHESFN